MSILDFFPRSKKPDPVTEELAADLGASLEAFQVQPQPTILDRSAALVTDFVHHARVQRALLANEIAEKTERLRQYDVAIAAFEPVLTKLDEGYDPADDARKSYDVAIEAKRKRNPPPVIKSEAA